jgi:hypothetical protein
MLLDWQRTGGGPRCRPLLRQRQASKALSGAHWACGGAQREGGACGVRFRHKTNKPRPGLSSPQPDPDHLAHWVRFLAPRPWV